VLLAIPEAKKIVKNGKRMAKEWQKMAKQAIEA
jgi:hypothetical protein